jgi:ribonucleoside-diphosphate reductase alpha chain
LLENSVWSASGNDFAVYIPIEEAETVITKDTLNDIEFAEHVKTVYQNWVLPGNNTERGYSSRVTHNVSNTITVEDWDAVFDYIYDNQEFFCGLSFLPAVGDKVYKQAPFTKVLNFKELIAEYGDASVFASGLVVDALHAFGGDLWDACEAVQNKEFPLAGDRFAVILKKDIVRRIKKFSKNYCKNNIDKTISCLKDVHLFHKWKTINREFKTIDFTTLDMKPSYANVNEIGGVACSADGCEITSI